jgi:signal recognition particle subunit SRP54
MLGMLPGAKGMREQLDNFDESEITRTEAIIQSMTVQERRQPRVLNGSRRVRIARGSGTTVTEVNALVNRFEQAAKMMKTVAKGGVPQVPGMGPIPGAGFGGGKKQIQKKKGSKSGNPAKRAAENAALASGVKPSTGAAGSGFGLGGAAKPGGPSEEELASLQKFLGR